MTSAIGIPQPVSPQLLTQEIHRLWLDETRGLLQAARGPEGGVQCRWNALKYLTDTVSRRFELEREVVESMGQRIEPAHAAQLWVTAELMAALGWRIAHAIGLCHRTGEFVALTRSYEKALEHWCSAVEAALSGLSWGKLPVETRCRLALLGSKEY